MGRWGLRELSLIAGIRKASEGAALRGSGAVRVGIGDDCAVLRPRAGADLVVTTDFTLEGRHFRRAWHAPESVGHRCLARGLSDVAAMGAEPMAAFLSLALPVGTKRTWVDGFFSGLRALAERYGVPLAGGDTAQAPGAEILADIVLVGSVPRATALRRCGAKVGDVLYVTGTLGGAAAELERLRTGRVRRVRAGTREEHPQLFPEPRVAVGAMLRKRGWAAACLDVSDGLSTDLGHLCRESGVGAEIEVGELPVHPGATVEQALDGGEDYELLFAAPAGVRVPKRVAGVGVTAIGRVVAAGVWRVENGKRTRLKEMGWEHFRS